MGALLATVQTSGTIFNIQRYSLHDGEGIRTIVFMKGCPLRCLWCANPESQRVAPEIMVRHANCIGCGRCVSICPERAISASAEGPRHNAQLCTVCGRCAEICNTNGISLVGQEITAEEVYRQIDRDRIFYRHSGGGVTFSGGEPLLQPNFLLAMLRLCKQGGLHTTIETCGACSWASIERTMADTDMYYYDVKVIDPQAHKQLTGMDNRILLANLERLNQHHRNLFVRTPLVPGFNDGKHLEELGRYLNEVGIHTIQLLPYHGYGAGKYDAIGRNYPLKQTRAPTRSMMEKAAEVLSKYDIKALIG